MLTDKVCLSASLIFSIFVTVSLSNPDITALLSFRASSDPHNSLASWLNSSDHCSGSWLGVACDRETRRVTRLVLENLNLSLKKNRVSNGPHLLDLSSWPNLKQLYLSHNSFAGEFPAGISGLRRLQRLDLSHNGFSGKIPMAELAQLPRLLTVRIELNSFVGDLGAVNYSYPYSISELNVSRNNLSGAIPAWLSHFDAPSFGGNKRLCGKPLPYGCPYPTDQKKPQKSDKNDRGLCRPVVLTTLICVAVAAVLAAAGVTVACWWRKRSTCISRDDHYSRRQCGAPGVYGGPKWDREGVVVFDGCKKGIGRVSDLLSASAEMLGKGRVGTTYEVVMDGGDRVVVKRVREGRLGKEADWWLREIIGRLRHANIVSLRAYHRLQNHDHDNQLLLLVYDFLPNGSLHYLLHGDPEEPHWIGPRGRHYSGNTSAHRKQFLKRQENEMEIIPYNHFTYGELAAEVVAEGLLLCNDIKLKRQLEKDKLLGKKSLGDFCELFGYPPINNPHRKSKKFERSYVKKFKKGGKDYKKYFPQKEKKI